MQPEDVCPLEGLKVPAGHCVQSRGVREPGELLKVPEGHREHAVVPGAEA